MKNSIIAFSLIIGLVACNSSTQTAPATGPDAVALDAKVYSLEGGYPAKENVQKLYDELDYQRAVQAYIWAIPAVDVEVLGNGMKQMGVNSLSTIGIFENFLDANTVVLTGNGQSIYAFNNI